MVAFAHMALGTSCLKVDLQDGFPCSSDGRCPSPYQCMQGGCYRGTRPLTQGAGGSDGGSVFVETVDGPSASKDTSDRPGDAEPIVDALDGGADGDAGASDGGDGAVVPPTLVGIKQISMSQGLYACAAMKDGTARCWGPNQDGQLGNGTTTPSTTPVVVSGLTNAVSISTGAGHACAVMADMTARCWGLNTSGQLGNGMTTSSAIPVTVSNLTGVVSIAAGHSHTCAALANGTARCWGDNSLDELGMGTTGNPSSTPVDVSGLTNVVSVAAGDYFTCALLQAGTVSCWGGNVGAPFASKPVPINGLTGVASISGGGGATDSCALLTTGSVLLWTTNPGSNGVLPNPVAVVGLTSVAGVSAGGTVSCAALTDGNAVCWGSDDVGQLGNGTYTGTSSLTPTTVSGLSNVVSVSAGGSSACAVLMDGTAACWGANSFGQLGNGSKAMSLVPVPVVGY